MGRLVKSLVENPVRGNDPGQREGHQQHGTEGQRIQVFPKEQSHSIVG